MATNKGAELLESLKTQGLSQQEMLNRLDAIIDAESARPEGKRDRELIQACIDLQWFLTTGEHYTSCLLYTSYRDNFLRQVKISNLIGKKM